MPNDVSNRRKFLEFFGRTSAAVSLTTLVSDSSFAGEAIRHLASIAPPFKPITPGKQDTVKLAEGFQSRVLIGYGTQINSQGEKFGYNNDYTAFIPDGKNQGILWVNHESTHTLFVSGRKPLGPPTKEQIHAEQLSVGGSVLRVKADKNGEWNIVLNDPINKRFTALTEIPIVAPREILGKKVAIGTLGNCAGGVTPWGNILTCEENWYYFYGDVTYSDKAQNRKHSVSSKFGWENFFDYPPEHYGWVVEVDPRKGTAKKLTALGRFAHECATTTIARDGRCVVYSGDDDDNRCLYKFIADKAGSLDTGTLYVADLKKGRWTPVVINKHKILQDKFVDQLDVLIRCRDAAQLIGGTPLDRPEDIEIDPTSKAVFVSLTNNASKMNIYGSILKLVENDNDPLALEFSHSTFVTGGKASGLACPDNLAFDRKGNLWVTSDISNNFLNMGPYSRFGNNGLYYIPMSGAYAGKVFQVAHGPIGSEFTGPSFSPDGRTLFLSVQHPGEEGPSLSQLSSHWPDGGKAVPRPCVIAITGPTLDALVI